MEPKIAKQSKVITRAKVNSIQSRDLLTVEKNKLVGVLEEKKEFYQKEYVRYGKLVPYNFFRELNCQHCGQL